MYDHDYDWNKYNLKDRSPQVLQVTVNVIHKDAEKKKTFFNPRPYFRLFVNWFLDLLTPDNILDTANFQVRTVTSF